MQYQKATIQSLDSEGRGIARVNEKVIFINNALPGEEVLYKTTKRKKNYEIAETIQILKSSPFRVKPPCQYFSLCGGCSLQHLEINTQVAFKQKFLEDNLWRIGKCKANIILPIIHGPNLGYRFRARMSVKYVHKKDSVLIGFHEKKSPFIVDMTSCKIVPNHVSNLIPPLRQLINELSIRDKIPQIEWAVGDNTTVMTFRIMQDLTAEDERKLRNFIEVHQNSNHQLQLWLQPKGLDSLYTFYPLNGKKELYYYLTEFNIQIPFHPSEFTQVNPGMNDSMVSRAIHLLKPTKDDEIMDFFCGLGNFTLPIAKKGASVTGIEGSKILVNRARENAHLNHLTQKTQFHVANLFDDTQMDMRNWAKKKKWLIDPPRDGAFELVKNIPNQNAIEKIVYISCKPSTLARDAEIIISKGFSLEAIGVMNMFPHTTHIESIAVFNKKFI